MLEKEFVPYEQALALKELGFDEPCFGGYDMETLKLWIGYLNDGEQFNREYYYPAPTYSQAFRWFRKKYNLKSWVEEYTKNKYIYEIRPHKITDYKEGEIYVYATYEEAEIACLNKLIEIVKEKKNG
jgi:hypothetical protein